MASRVAVLGVVPTTLQLALSGSPVVPVYLKAEEHRPGLILESGTLRVVPHLCRCLFILFLSAFVLFRFSSLSTWRITQIRLALHLPLRTEALVLQQWRVLEPRPFWRVPSALTQGLGPAQGQPTSGDWLPGRYNYLASFAPICTTLQGHPSS